jgi:hypothetical protein
VLGSSDQGSSSDGSGSQKRTGESKSLVANEDKNQKVEDFHGNKENRRASSQRPKSTGNKTRTKEKQEPSKILLGFEEQTMGERTDSTDSSRNKELKQAAMHKLGRV